MITKVADHFFRDVYVVEDMENVRIEFISGYRIRIISPFQAAGNIGGTTTPPLEGHVKSATGDEFRMSLTSDCINESRGKNAYAVSYSIILADPSHHTYRWKYDEIKAGGDDSQKNSSSLDRCVAFDYELAFLDNGHCLR